MSSIPGPSSRATTSMPWRPLPSRTIAQQHLAARRVGRDVARHLGDRGGEQRLVGASSARARRRAPARAGARSRRRRRTRSRSGSQPATVERLLAAGTAAAPAPPRGRARSARPRSSSRAGPSRTRPRAGCRRSPSPRRAGASSCAIPRSERETNESITSSAVTSTMIPRERWRVTWRHHVVAQLQDVGVGQRRLDRRDQERALLEDRDGHASATVGRVDAVARAMTCSRAAARPPRCRPGGRRPR